MFDTDVSLNGSDWTKSEQHIMQEAVVCRTVDHTDSRNGPRMKVGTRSKANETQKN